MVEMSWTILDNLDRGGLLALRAEIDARLEAQETDLGAVEVIRENGTAPKSRKRGGRWVELKRINGCGPYAYERWLEGGVKKSRYLGKAVDHGE